MTMLVFVSKISIALALLVTSAQGFNLPGGTPLLKAETSLLQANSTELLDWGTPLLEVETSSFKANSTELTHPHGDGTPLLKAETSLFQANSTELNHSITAPVDGTPPLKAAPSLFQANSTETRPRSWNDVAISRRMKDKWKEHPDQITVGGKTVTVPSTGTFPSDHYDDVDVAHGANATYIGAHEYHFHVANQGLDEFEGMVKVEYKGTHEVNGRGKLADGWPPSDADTCKKILGEDWTSFDVRMEWWFGQLNKRMTNKIYKPHDHSCCGAAFPFNSGVSYSYAGGGCPAFIVNANFMDVATWYLPGAEVLSTVSAGTWYSAADHYGNRRWPHGRGTRLYSTGQWDKRMEEEAFDAKKMGLDDACVNPEDGKGGMMANVAKNMMRVVVDKYYTIAYAWEDAVYDTYLKPVGIPKSLEFGQAVSQYEWVQEFCGDWAPVSTVMKRDFHTGTPFLYGIWPFYRRRYKDTTAGWTQKDEFDSYQHAPFDAIVSASSSYFGAVLGFSQVAWQVLCDKYPGVPACSANTNIPPAWFDDTVDAIMIPIDANVNWIYDSAKQPFFVDGYEHQGWDCPREPDTVFGRFNKMIHPSYTPCMQTDGGVSDNTGFIANLVTREWVVIGSPLRRYYSQNKIITVQAAPDMSMIPALCGFSIQKMRNQLLDSGTRDGTWEKLELYIPGMNMGGPYGNPSFKPYVQFDPYQAIGNLVKTGLSVWPTKILKNEDLGTRGNYSLLLNFVAMVKNKYSKTFRSMKMPESYALTAKMYNFPEVPTMFAYPLKVVKSLAIFAEYSAMQQLYVQRWTGYCWAWLDYMSHEWWFSDAVCFCFSAPFSIVTEVQTSGKVDMDQPVYKQYNNDVQFFADAMAGLAHGYYGTPHFIHSDGSFHTIQDVASYLLTHEVMDYMHEAAEIGNIPSAVEVSAKEARKYLPPFWTYPAHLCQVSNREKFSQIEMTIKAQKKDPMGSFIYSHSDAYWRWGETNEDYNKAMDSFWQVPYDSHGAMWGYGKRGMTDYVNFLPTPAQDFLDNLGALNEHSSMGYA